MQVTAHVSSCYAVFAERHLHHKGLLQSTERYKGHCNPAHWIASHVLCFDGLSTAVKKQVLGMGNATERRCWCRCEQDSDGLAQGTNKRGGCGALWGEAGSGSHSRDCGGEPRSRSPGLIIMLYYWAPHYYRGPGFAQLCAWRCI